jgi:hypothetical protein
LVGIYSLLELVEQDMVGSMSLSMNYDDDRVNSAYSGSDDGGNGFDNGGQDSTNGGQDSTNGGTVGDGTQGSSPTLITSQLPSSVPSSVPSMVPKASTTDFDLSSVTAFECTANGLGIAGSLGNETTLMQLTVAYAAEAINSTIDDDALDELELLMLETAVGSALECVTDRRRRRLVFGHRNLATSTQVLSK